MQQLRQLSGSNDTGNGTSDGTCPSCCNNSSDSSSQNSTPTTCNVTTESCSCSPTTTGVFTSPSCKYRQLTTESFPNVTAISNSVSNKIVFDGTGFFLSGYTAHASYSGIPADNVVVDGA
jgi:hypothetical protein